MSFLAPLFLLGGLAIALPVVFHLIRRSTRERTEFSSLMFLAATPPRLSQRRRLEHILLLLLRCAVIGLLAVGFARPFLRQPGDRAGDAGRGRRTILLVDTSASMRRENLWPEARDRAGAVLRAALPAEQFAVYAFDRGIKPLLTFEQWKAAPPDRRRALAEEKLREASPGWGATQLGKALAAAAELLADPEDRAASGPGRIVLITDLQEGAHPETLQGFEWPKGVEVATELVKPRRPGNASVHWVAAAEEMKAQASVRVRVYNSGDSPMEQFNLGWMAADGRSFRDSPVALYVPRGQTRTVELPGASTNGPSAQIGLRGDEQEFDDVAFAPALVAERVKVLYVGSEAEQDSRAPYYFLRRAFQETRRQAVELAKSGPEAAVPQSESHSSRLVIVGESLPEARALALREEVLAGKTLLFLLRQSGVGPTLARLLGLERVGIEESSGRNYALLAEIDFGHPLFSSFADPRFSDFSKIHFWKHRRLDAAGIPAARAVAAFDNGDAAVLDIPAGKGRVVVLASGWEPSDSQLALSTKFVPLLYSLLELAGTHGPAPAQYYVGDSVRFEPAAGPGQGITVRVPSGLEIHLAPGETNFTHTMEPGVYQVRSGESSYQFAVNLDPAESRTAPLAAGELERLGVPMARTAVEMTRDHERKLALKDVEMENRQKLWRWCICGTLAILLAETWLAGRAAARRARLPESPNSTPEQSRAAVL